MNIMNNKHMHGDLHVHFIALDTVYKLCETAERLERNCGQDLRTAVKMRSFDSKTSGFWFLGILLVVLANRAIRASQLNAEFCRQRIFKPSKGRN